jgi:flagellar protein FliO/FliZ
MRRLRALLAAGATLAALTVATAAVDDTKIFTPGAAAPAGVTASGPGLGSVTLVVGLVLAGVGGWLVWRARGGTPVGREARRLNLLETRSLGSRQFLVVAAYDDKKYLLGVCPGRIDLLAPLTDADADGDGDVRA